MPVSEDLHTCHESFKGRLLLEFEMGAATWPAQQPRSKKLQSNDRPHEGAYDSTCILFKCLHQHRYLLILGTLLSNTETMSLPLGPLLPYTEVDDGQEQIHAGAVIKLPHLCTHGHWRFRNGHILPPDYPCPDAESNPVADLGRQARSG